MKLIIAGASGFCGTECVRQALSHPSITSVIALARREIPVPEGLDPTADPSKLHSVVIKDYDTYTDDVKNEFQGADACIWTVAVTPIKSRGLSSEEVKRICHDMALQGFQTMLESLGDRPSSTSFRFLYMSGIGAERDQTKQPRMMPEYCLMRGAAESAVLSFAAEHKDHPEACTAKPGLIVRQSNLFLSVFRTLGIPTPTLVVSWIGVGEVCAAMLNQVVVGFEKEPLFHDDLVRIGIEAMKRG